MYVIGINSSLRISLIFAVLSIVQIVSAFYMLKLPHVTMNMIEWKCYRCNLVFKEKSHTEIHNRISSHSVTEIKIAAS